MSENFSAEVYLSQQSDVIYIKLLGEVRFRNSRLLQKCLEVIEASLDLKGLIIDLTETHSVDSTILGVLAEIGITASRMLTEKPILLAHPDDIYKILSAMAFDHIYHLVTDLPEKNLQLDRIETQEDTDHELVLRVLAAHKTLSNLSPQNAEQFREVIELFENNLKKIS